MKKKILKIVSSILGVFAICGLSLFSLLEHKKDTQSVSAVISNQTTPLQFTDLNAVSTYVYTENVVYNGVPTTFRCVWDFNLFCTVGISYRLSDSKYKYIFDCSVSNSNNYIRTYKQYGDNPLFDFYNLKIGGARSNFHFETSFVDDLDLVNCFVYISNISSSSDNTFILNGRINNTYDTSYSGLTFLDKDNNNTNVTNLLSYFPTNHKLCDFTDYLESFTSGSNIADTYYDIGFDEGTSNGYNDGYAQGVYDTNLSGVGGNVTDSYNQGYADGYAEGSAFSEVASDTIYDLGYADGISSQYTEIAQSYQQGYSAGLSEGLNSDATVATIFSNILLVGMLPVDFFLRILNWNFLGINIASFVSALLSVAATIIVIRFVTGKKE